MPRSLVVFPAHALLIVEERLREQQAEGVETPKGMPLEELALRILKGMPLEELALRILIAAETAEVPSLG